LYLCLAPEQFDTEQEKVLWALTFFKSGCASKWSENLFREEAVTSIFLLCSWASFEQQFWAQFLLVSAEADAINTLEGTSYFQGSQTVNDYLDGFHGLVSDAGYTDLHTLVVKFCRGLRNAIQGQIATMPMGRPGDTDP